MNFKKNWALIILIIAIVAIATALIAEHIFNILPCQMCIYQRYSYYSLIILSIIFLLLKKQNSSIYYLLVEIMLIVGLFFSLWHIGIENHLIGGPSSCSSDMGNISNIQDLKEYILNRPVIACDEINWTFLGVSFAIYNSILQMILLINNSRYILKKNG